MIVVREVFQIAPEGMKEAKQLVRDGMQLMERAGMKGLRAMTDLTGDFYTLVTEIEYESLGAFEAKLTELFQDPEFQVWYPRLRKHIRGGRREVYTVFG